MRSNRPNLLLLMTDQHRADCLGLAGHPVLQTPHLDDIGLNGLYFPRAYSACPQCIPARRSLLTGKTPHGHGVYSNTPAPLEGPTLPGELAKAGYHTHLCGKIHTHPRRALYGFMSADWSDGIRGSGNDDFERFLAREAPQHRDAAYLPIPLRNTWVARPWAMEERLHRTNWTTDRALDFLERRDPTKPFFLNVSYYHPHQPCTPPQTFWDRYIDADLPEPVEADWSRKIHTRPRAHPTESWAVNLSGAEIRQFQAGYYGSINHIDEQIGRILAALPPNTVIIFTSDHGEMLGDHQWTRKTRALEGSARIPFLIKLPDEVGVDAGQIRDEVVELMDIMPTCLDLAGAPIPESVEGSSLLRRLRDGTPWRERIHGEQSAVGGEDTGMQYLTDGRRKYIWEPGLGRELFFDLEKDPLERINLAEKSHLENDISSWRNDLIARLADRPEGFVKDGRLQKLPGATRRSIPEYAGQGERLSTGRFRNEGP